LFEALECVMRTSGEHDATDTYLNISGPLDVKFESRRTVRDATI
jgi:hypothetical protein